MHMRRTFFKTPVIQNNNIMHRILVYSAKRKIMQNCQFYIQHWKKIPTVNCQRESH